MDFYGKGNDNDNENGNENENGNDNGCVRGDGETGHYSSFMRR